MPKKWALTYYSGYYQTLPTDRKKLNIFGQWSWKYFGKYIPIDVDLWFVRGFACVCCVHHTKTTAVSCANCWHQWLAAQLVVLCVCYRRERRSGCGIVWLWQVSDVIFSLISIILSYNRIWMTQAAQDKGNIFCKYMSAYITNSMRLCLLRIAI